MKESCAGCKENTDRINKLDKMVTVDMAVIKQEMKNISGHIGDIKTIISEYIVSAKETFVTKSELNIYVRDGKYAKLWTGVVGGCVGFVFTIVLAVIISLKFPA